MRLNLINNRVRFITIETDFFMIFLDLLSENDFNTVDSHPTSYNCETDSFVQNGNYKTRI